MTYSREVVNAVSCFLSNHERPQTAQVVVTVHPRSAYSVTTDATVEIRRVDDSVHTCSAGTRNFH